MDGYFHFHVNNLSNCEFYEEQADNTIYIFEQKLDPSYVLDLIDPKSTLKKTRGME